MATNDETIPIEDALKEIRDGVYLKSDSWSNEEVAKVVELYYKKGSTEARADERAKVEEDFLSTDLINTETYKRNITKARSDTAKQIFKAIEDFKEDLVKDIDDNLVVYILGDLWQRVEPLKKEIWGRLIE